MKGSRVRVPPSALAETRSPPASGLSHFRAGVRGLAGAPLRPVRVRAISACMEALRYVRNCVGAVLACVALLALGGAPAHAADLGAPYATVTVSCPAGGSSGDVFAAPVDE